MCDFALELKGSDQSFDGVCLKHVVSLNSCTDWTDDTGVQGRAGWSAVIGSLGM